MAPQISNASGEFSLGQSHYNTLEKTDSHVVVEVAENSRVREILEVDGRTTMFINDIPYRLDGETLRRVSSLDTSNKLKQRPCRARRALGDICKNNYVSTDGPADRPPIGTIREKKGWAPWFGDETFYPSTPKSTKDSSLLAYEGKIYHHINDKLNTYKGKLEWVGLTQRTPIPKELVSAEIEFQSGIYGSIKVTGTAEHIDDVHIVGAIIVPSIDEKTKYIFTRLNIDNYYMTSLPIHENILTPLTMKKLSPNELLKGTFGKELEIVYSGSLNANNNARIHGIDTVEAALTKMNEIAIPIGTSLNPPTDMKWLKVDTSPAEALMFDQRTRMMVVELPDGAKLWKPNIQAPADLQKSTAETFDALFSGSTLPGSSGTSKTAVGIDQAMEALHKLIPVHQTSASFRNIAYAKVKNAAGRDEVYVSVSGAGDNTRHLPLFKNRENVPEISFNGTSYFNIDKLKPGTDLTSLRQSADGKLLAIPHPIDDASKSDHINRITSVDSESKLVAFINEKYPNPEDIKSITVVTTLPPCNSCSIVLKEFGHERGADALNVIWGKRPNTQKRPAADDSTSSSSSSSGSDSDSGSSSHSSSSSSSSPARSPNDPS
ncbi:deaminase domain-containing protein [Pseudomonas sp. LB3P14]